MEEYDVDRKNRESPHELARENDGYNIATAPKREPEAKLRKPTKEEEDEIDAMADSLEEQGVFEKEKD